jgi:hypothetical protein
VAPTFGLRQNIDDPGETDVILKSPVSFLGHENFQMLLSDNPDFTAFVEKIISNHRTHPPKYGMIITEADRKERGNTLTNNLFLDHRSLRDTRRDIPSSRARSCLREENRTIPPTPPHKHSYSFRTRLDPEEGREQRASNEGSYEEAVTQFVEYALEIPPSLNLSAIGTGKYDVPK